MRRAEGGIPEALAFAGATLAYIWRLRFSAPWTVWILLAWALIAIVRYNDSLDASGLSPRRLVQTLAEWRLLWLAALLALGLTLRERLADPRLLASGASYFLWCCLQQAVYQNLVYARVRASLGPARAAWLLSGLVFGLVHWPNPVLAPATALWGAASSYLFERRPSVVALALLQTALSSLLYELTPWEWHQGFRVGPGYFPTW